MRNLRKYSMLCTKFLIIFQCFYLCGCGNKGQSKQNREFERHSEEGERFDSNPFDDERGKNKLSDLEKVSSEKIELENQLQIEKNKNNELQKTKKELSERNFFLENIKIGKMHIGILENGLKVCIDILEGDEKSFSKIQSYNELKSYFEQKSERYKDCKRTLDRIFIGDTEPIFFSKYYENEGLYDTHLIKQARIYENIFSVLTDPENTLPLTQKVPSEMLCPLKVEEYTRMLANIFPFEQVSSQDAVIYSQEALLLRKFDVSRILFKDLDYARNLINTAITQQNILIGKNMLETFDLQNPYIVWREKILPLLKENPILMTNLFLQDLRKSRKDLKLSENLEGEDFNVDNVEELNNRYPTWKFKNSDGVLKVFYQVFQERRVEDASTEVEIHTVTFEDGKLKASEKLSEDSLVHTDYLDNLLKFHDEFKSLVTENKQSVERFLMKSED